MKAYPLLLFFTLFVGLCTISTQAQPLGGKSRYMEWQEFNSNYGKYIYPKAITSQALETAQLIHALHLYNPIQYPTKSRKFAILINHKTIESNGYVALAPFRSELFATPPQSLNSLGTTNWMKLLAIHEERHIQQFNHANKGISKLAYYLSGDFGLSVAQFLAIPNWFFEGDAVLTETVLSHSGRGRVPHFTAFQRSIAHTNTTYSYHKIRNGSYKDLVPNHYVWGYSFLAELSKEKGFDIFADILEDAASYKSVFYPFSRSLKKHSSYTTKSLYLKSWDSSKKFWQKQLQNKTLTPTQALSDTSLKVVTTYAFPQYINDSSFIVRKRTNKSTDQIVLYQKNKKEKIILHPGASENAFFHYKDSLMVWTVYQNHPRRVSESYENIMLYDFKEKKQKQITKKGRFFSPVVAPKSSNIYALKYSENLQSELYVFDIKRHEEKKIYNFPPSAFVARLTLDEDEENLAYIKRKNDLAAIFIFNLTTQKETQITPWSAHTLDAPRIKNDFVFYEAGYNQVNNLYKSPSKGSLEVIQLTEVPLGAYQADLSPNGENLIFKEVIFNGNQLSSLALKDALNQTLEPVEPVQQNWRYPHLNLVFDEEFSAINKPMPSHFTTPKAHQGIFRGTRLHSWLIETSPASQGIQLYFNNFVNDLSATLGGGYNHNEKGEYYKGELNYGRWLPILSLNGDYNYRYIQQFGESAELKEEVYRQKSGGLKARIPLEWKMENFDSKIEVETGAKWVNLQNNSDNYLKNFQIAHAAFNFTFKRRKAIQQLNSPLGIENQLYYGKSIEGKSIERIQTEGRIYLPSFFKTHSLQLAMGYKKELEENIYREVDNFNYSRGYQQSFGDEYLRYSIDYHFPLFYPDWGFGGITYFKRIRAQLYYDYGKNKINRTKETYDLSATGIEINFDNTFFNILPLSIGIQASYKLKATPYDNLEYPWDYRITISNAF